MQKAQVRRASQHRNKQKAKNEGAQQKRQIPNNDCQRNSMASKKKQRRMYELKILKIRNRKIVIILKKSKES